MNPKLILIGKNTQIPNFVKKGKILEKISVRILKNSLYGYYQIRISSNYKKGKLNLKADEEYVNNCPVCVQSSRTIHRTNPVKSINVNGPNIRYEFDIKYFNNDFGNAFGFK